MAQMCACVSCVCVCAVDVHHTLVTWCLCEFVQLIRIDLHLMCVRACQHAKWPNNIPCTTYESLADKIVDHLYFKAAFSLIQNEFKQ